MDCSTTNYRQMHFFLTVYLEIEGIIFTVKGELSLSI
jgi:hypothetical protein